MNDMIHPPSDHTWAHEDRMRETYARMSRQIALAFAQMPEDEAAAAVANHINLFWSRTMRRDLARIFDANSPDLHKLVRKAWVEIRMPEV